MVAGTKRYQGPLKECFFGRRQTHMSSTSARARGRSDRGAAGRGTAANVSTHEVPADNVVTTHQPARMTE